MSNLSEESKNEIIKTYYNPSIGLSVKSVYNNLNKKYKLKDITNVINQLEDRQINKQKPVDKENYIKITAPPYTYQMDLSFFNQFSKSNSGYSILYVFININTRKLYVYPIKNKKKPSIEEAFNKFLKDIDYKIDRVESDFGSEYISKNFKAILDKYNIKQIVFNKEKSPNALSIVERVNRTIRQKILDYQTAYKTKKYIDVLPSLVDNYNNSIHSTLKRKPNDITEKEEEKISLETMENELNKINEIKEDYKIGDKVRIRKTKDIFDKLGTKFSKSVYEIVGYDGKGIIVSNNKKEKKVFPYMLQKLDNVITNPYITKSNAAIKGSNTKFKNEKIKIKVNKELAKEGVQKSNIIRAKKRSDVRKK